jgi:hypothetical protein
MKIGDVVELKSGMCSVDMLGHPKGTYTVCVGDYGWDDGDLFIETQKGKLKLRELRQMGDIK